jgi:DNA-directed RNA polymerase beta subunit
MPEKLLDTLAVEPAPVKRRGWNDFDATRQAFYDKAIQGIKDRFDTLENQTHKLSVDNLRYDTKLPKLRDEAEAINGRHTLTRKLHGTYKLIDKATGQVISEKDALVANIPHVTKRGTFIRGGHEYLLFNQQRLKAGTYTRQKKNGDYETQFNILPGTGRGFRMNLEKDSGTVKFQIGQGSLRAYPVLKAMGINDEQIKEAWGDDLWRSNSQIREKGNDVFKFVSSLAGTKDGVTEQNYREKLPLILDRMRLDNRVTKRTLGKAYDRLSPEAFLAANKKLMSVYKGAAQPDERDAIDFQSFHTAEDYIYDNFKNDAAGVARKLLWKAAYTKNLDHVNPSAMTETVDRLFNETRLGSMITQVNPLEVLDLHNKITRMGEGGIGDQRAISKDARGVQPTHLGIIDPLRAPESQAIGLDSRIAYQTFKGDDGQVYTQVKDPKTGEEKTVSASEVVDSVVAFPGELATDKKFVVAMTNGKMQLVNRKKVKYEIPHAEDMYSPLTSMIPLMAHAKGQRMLMGSRMATQAVSLADPEARLIQAKDARSGKSFDELFSKQMGAVYSDKAGTVKSVTPDSVIVSNEDGTESEYETYNNFAFNTKGFLHNTTNLQPGTKIGAGQLVARSNFTDAAGKTAYGKNLRVAFHPYNQYTHDDGIVVSETTANKMASEQMYKHTLDKYDNVDSVDYNRFISLFPDKYKREQMANMDPESGIIKVGATVNTGDPLILGIGKSNDQTLSAIMKQKKSFYNDSSIIWDHHNPGVVVDARKGRGGWQVIVKAKTPIAEGDKLSNSYGGKGVVSKILPDDKMPTDEAGNPVDIILSPGGLSSRVNPAQVVEAMLGKVARKTGIPYVMPTFNPGQDMMQFAIDEMNKHGLKDRETIYDPASDKHIPNVFTGDMYFMRLYHMAEDKMSARNTGLYGSDFSPAKGGDEMQQSKRLGNLDVNALITYGATNVLKDRVVRAQQNDDYWRMFRMGYEPKTPEVYEPYQRFINYVQGAGAQIKKEGSKTHLFPLTDKAVGDLATDQLDNAETIDFNSTEPVTGGLFDIQKTGGKGGNKWTYIKLSKPIPNPAVETPLRVLLGLTGPAYENIISGKENIGPLTGTDAISAELSKIKVPEEIKKQQDIVASTRGDKRDKAVKKLRLLKVMSSYGFEPKELLISKIPVLPPKYRPIAVVGGTQLVSDPNYLYKEVFEANSNLQDAATELGNDAAHEDTLTLYKSVKGLFGLGDPTNTKNQERNVRGLLRDFVGKGSPKGGAWQRRVLGGTLDTVGRSVIVPDPQLEMDEVSLPNGMAWTLYEPFVMRELVRRGMPAMAAKHAIDEHTPAASKVLDAVMEKRPVMLNRAPTLHKHNITGHFAKRHEGSAIRVPLATLSGWGADFDGDAMNVHVPVSDDAVEDVIDKMLPSRNLMTAKTMGIHMKPEQMALLGLYRATAPAKGEAPVKFASVAEAIAAYNKGAISVNTPVIIG